MMEARWADGMVVSLLPLGCLGVGTGFESRPYAFLRMYYLLRPVNRLAYPQSLLVHTVSATFRGTGTS